MGFEREKRVAVDPKDHGLDDELVKRLLDEHQPAYPGKQTLIEQLLTGGLAERAGSRLVVGRRTLLDQVSEPPVSAPSHRSILDPAASPSTFDNFRSQGLQEVLAVLTFMRCGRGLMEATLSAAKKATRPVQPSLTVRPAPPDPIGQAMWRVVERRAATLYRHAVESGDIKTEDRAVEAALAHAGGGQLLPAAIRRKMELALGISLARVRIHVDSVAADAARAVRAKAFTVGEDIYFADGAYAPETPAGQRLLAHELTHVVQAYQGRTETSGMGIKVSNPDEPLEREADAIADRIGDQHPAPKYAPKPAPALSTSAARAYVMRAPAHKRSAEQSKPPRVDPNDPVVSVLVVLASKAIYFKLQSGTTYRYTITTSNLTAGSYFSEKQKQGQLTIDADVPSIKGSRFVLEFKGSRDLPNPYDLPYLKRVPLTVVVDMVVGGGNSGTKPLATGSGNSGGKPLAKGARPPSASPPDGANGPVIDIATQAELDELIAKGLIPKKAAESIGKKIENNERLSFDEAKALLEAYRSLIAVEQEQGKDKSKASKDSQRWVEWAKFIQTNRDKISGQSKAGKDGLRVEDVKEVIAKYKKYVGVKDPPTVLTRDKLAQVNFDPELRESWNKLAQWEKDIWTQYAKRFPSSKMSDRKDMKLTQDDLMRMALRMSPDYMKEGFRDAAREMFNEPAFIISTAASITLYVIAILSPEPLFSKATAAAITAFLLTVFSFSEIKNLVTAWWRLREKAGRAKSMKDLEAAAEDFGKSVGGTGLRVLVMLFTYFAGKALPAPKPGAGGGGGMAPATAGPGGARVVIVQGTRIEILADGTAVMTPIAMATAGSGAGGGGSSPKGNPGSKDETTVPKEPGAEPQAPSDTKGKTHSEHAKQRAAQGRRTGPAFGDAQRARPADVYVQPDGRYVVRGPRGREHIFEPDGTHITSIDRSAKAHQGKVDAGERSPITIEGFKRFQEIFR